MLTKRRLQFLAGLKKIYEETSAPVHYISVAEKLKVSKWTAYDLLQELEKEGYLRREYVVGQEKLPGRSMVMFVPTDNAYRVQEDAEEDKTFTSEWLSVRKYLLSILPHLKAGETGPEVEKLLAEMAIKKEHPLIWSAYTLTLLLISLKSLGEKGLNMVKNLFKGAPGPEAGLILVAGTGLGTALQSSSSLPWQNQLTAFVGRLQEHITQITHKEKKMLADFLQEALEITP
ncbi:MAG: hypothetical protein PWP65_1329 [Clostridia bacterium]|nr:hypothetical protein [Clostridia bacterium]